MIRNRICMPRLVQPESDPDSSLGDGSTASAESPICVYQTAMRAKAPHPGWCGQGLNTMQMRESIMAVVKAEAPQGVRTGVSLTISLWLLHMRRCPRIRT
jgi:hypothetical protein